MPKQAYITTTVNHLQVTLLFLMPPNSYSKLGASYERPNT